MKKDFFLRALALSVLTGFAATSAMAANVRVPDGATDTELAAALEQAETGDVIFIDGWVTINAMVHIEKNVKIVAGVDNAGFDGQHNSRLFEIHPPVEDGTKLVFENLGFLNGDGWKSDPTDGGVARIYGGETEFVLCYFDGNVARRGGAFQITENGTTVSFKACEATNNIAQGDGGESRGGYLFTDGETNISHEYCKISGSQSIGGRGGALCLFGNGTRSFYYTIISDSKAGNWGPDPAGDPAVDVKLDKDGNPVGDGEYEGGVAFITGGATTFESCGIIANKSWSHAGIIRSWGNAETSVTFINSTVTKNQSLHDRAPIWTGGDATYTFVNSLFVDNLGQNQGNGAGFDFDGAGVKLNIFNSVFARNMAGTDGAVDIRNGAPYANLTVKNSLIGLIQGDASGVVPVDNASIATKSNIAMYKLANEEAALADDVAILETSGVDFSEGVKYSSSFGMPYYLLKADGIVTKLGDPALLEEYSTVDLFDTAREPAADGSITAAPTNASVAAEYNDSGWDTPYLESLTPPTGTGIGSTEAAPAAGQAVKAITTVVSNGILGVDFGELRGHAKGELVALTGQVVEKVFSTTVVSKGYYNVHVAPGFYILKVTIDGKTYADRVIVK